MLDIPDYLITPIQRLPRYGLLITNILKSMNSDHPDYINLHKASDTIHEITNYVNQSMKSNDKLKEFLELVEKGNYKVQF